MRIDLLFGFLGSGKTTLARRILEEWGPKERLALIVNEFGDVGVDGDILKGNDIDVIQLSSGCLCCTLKGSLLSAVEELARKAPVDHIVIESTGVAEPEELLATFADPSFAERFDLGPVVAVVDASKYFKIRDLLGPFYEAQIEKADLIVLNKIDLADADALETVREEICDINPDGVIRFAERADIDVAEIMHGPKSEALERHLAGTKTSLQAHRHHEHHEHHDHGHDAGHDHGPLHAPAESFVVDVPGPVPRLALSELFRDAPERLWRAKGFVKVEGEPMLVQYAMGELELTPASARERHYLVFIGKDLDRRHFAEALEAMADAEVEA